VKAADDAFLGDRFVRDAGPMVAGPEDVGEGFNLVLGELAR
jgi:hypothetical protein